MSVRAALYVRVSTRDQSLVEQFRGLRLEAQARGWRVVGVYRERPELARLLAAAAMRRCDAILVWRLDRLGRSLLETFGNVEKLVQRGIRVVSVRDGALDTSTPAGRLQVAMLASCAEYEREVLRERTREGMARVQRLGTASGRPVGRPAVELDLAGVRLRLQQGEAAAAIARELGCSERTLRRRLAPAGPVDEKTRHLVALGSGSTRAVCGADAQDDRVPITADPRRAKCSDCRRGAKAAARAAVGKHAVSPANRHQDRA